MSKNFNSLKEIALRLRQRETAIMRRVATNTVNYSKQAFRKQAWDGKKWPQRKPDATRNKGRALLIDSGRMRNATRFKASSNTAVIYNTTPYAPAHNKGMTLHPRVTAKMKGFAWAMYKKTGQGKWKGLALTNKSQLTVKIPQRKFVGDSRQLRRQNGRIIEQEINEIIRIVQN